MKQLEKLFVKVILVFSCMFLMLPTQGFMFVSATEKTNEESQKAGFVGHSDVDDAITTDQNELFKIQYAPKDAWTAGTGSDALYNGTEHYSNQSNDASYRMTFIGTGFEIYASKNPNHGDCDVFVDGTNVGELIASDTKTAIHKQKVFSYDKLTDEQHELEVKVKNGENKAIQVDSIRVFHKELAPTQVALNRSDVTLIPGGTTKLHVTSSPWVATKKEIKWESDNQDVVTVNQEGVLVAKEVKTKQTANITAKAVSNEKVFAQATVTVDPSIAYMNAFIGDEKLLDVRDDYEALLGETKSHYQATAWKGDELNSKVVVASRGKAVHNVTITPSNFVSDNGHELNKDAVSVKWLKEVKANVGRGNPNAPVKDFPEMIHQGGAKNLEANSAAFAWVQIQVNENVVPGIYHGTLNVSADELSKPYELQYEIEVLNLAQPEMEATEVQVWQHPFAVANYYLGLGETPKDGITNETAENFYFTDAHFNLMRESMKEYVSLGGHDVVANIVEEAWGHQSYYNDLSMVKWTKKKDGSWKFDYTWYDAWINFMIECGVIDPANGIGQIKCYSIVPWNNQITYFDEKSGKIEKESHKPGSEGWKALWKPFLNDFLKHSSEKGWFDITYISMDERSLDDLKPAVEMIESVKNEKGKSFKISSALNYASPEYYDFTDRIHDISINLDSVGSVKQMNDLTTHRKAKGLVTTLYTCTGNYPSSYTISDPGDNYWTMWYTMTLGTDGFLRWAWDNYLYDMHGDVSYRYWEPGDGWFVFPEEREKVDVTKGDSAGIYTTPRYEMLKQGMRDVAKAKYLLSSGKLNKVQEKELKDVVENLQQPNGTTAYGSKVPATKEDRMLVHTQTTKALNVTNKIAREIAPDMQTVDKKELTTLITKAEALQEKDYTVETWSGFKQALEQAKTVSKDENATQEQVSEAIINLTNAMQNLKKVNEVKAPATGDTTKTLPLIVMMVVTGIGIAFMLRKRKEQ